MATSVARPTQLTVATRRFHHAMVLDAFSSGSHASQKDWLKCQPRSYLRLEAYSFFGAGSFLSVDKSLFVVDVPDSDRAPHQSKRDLKYYVRLGGKSRPASHRLIEDIRARAKHPNFELQLELGDFRIEGPELPPTPVACAASCPRLC